MTGLEEKHELAAVNIWQPVEVRVGDENSLAFRRESRRWKDLLTLLQTDRQYSSDSKLFLLPPQPP